MKDLKPFMRDSCEKSDPVSFRRCCAGYRQYGQYIYIVSHIQDKWHTCQSHPATAGREGWGTSKLLVGPVIWFWSQIHTYTSSAQAREITIVECSP
jgi:hypothetical protein